MSSKTISDPQPEKAEKRNPPKTQDNRPNQYRKSSKNLIDAQAISLLTDHIKEEIIP